MLKRTAALLSLGCLLAATPVQAQTYPSKTITIVVTAAAGGVSDVVARAIGQPKILDSAVRDVMDPPFPVVDGESPIALLTTLLSRTTPAALVRRNGKVVGIVTRYDLLHQLAGIR